MQEKLYWEKTIGKSYVPTEILKTVGAIIQEWNITSIHNQFHVTNGWYLIVMMEGSFKSAYLHRLFGELDMDCELNTYI